MICVLFLFFFLLLCFGSGWLGSCHVNSRFAPYLVVTGARLYFYDHSFVNEDTSKVFVPPEYTHEVVTVATLPAEASLSPAFIYVHAPCAFVGKPFFFFFNVG